MNKHVLLSLGLFLFLLPGLGFRHIWADEAETAEKARTILESGLPQVIDDEGRISTSSGGWEIEEGRLHRYTPWGQFYVAAAGLALAKPLGISKDTAVRLPFAAAHAATAGLISYGLVIFAGANPWVALSVGLAWGCRTIAILHNRSARYHALLDFLLLVGLLSLGALRFNSRGAYWSLAAAVFLLPQVHPVGGSLMSAGLCFAFCLQQFSWAESSGCIKIDSKKLLRGFCFLSCAGILSIIGILILTRPSKHTTWGNLTFVPNLKSLNDIDGISYGFYFLILSLGLILWVSKKNILAKKMDSLSFKAIKILVFTLLVLGVMSILESHPYSQSRYYLSLPTMFCLWPIFFGTEDFSLTSRKVIISCLLGTFILVEVLSFNYHLYQGVQVCWDDWQRKKASERQPLHQALDYVKENGHHDPVLFDYTPQILSWYLPEFSAALLPDVTDKTELNKNNPVWDRTILMPVWHIWYPEFQKGFWGCADHCDFEILDFNKEKNRYAIASKRLNTTVEMCVVKTWATSQWNNAPFDELRDYAFTPNGTPAGQLVLAKACDH